MGGRSGVGLTPRQARFVDEYLIDLNATQASIRAGYSAKTAQPQSSRLLSKVIVRAAIVDGKTERHTESVMSAVEALERASTIGRLDIRQFYRDDQSLKASRCKHGAVLQPEAHRNPHRASIRARGTGPSGDVPEC